MRLKFVVPLVLGLLAFSTSASSAFVDRTFVSNYENVLGTSLELKVGTPSQTAADRAEEAVLSEIKRESLILSAWDPNSEFSKWTRTQGQPVHVSRELFEVLDLFDQWRVRTHGALDASAQSVIAVWKAAAAHQRVPTTDELDAAVRSVKQQHWSLDVTKQTATHLSNAPLVLASFTKSYIIDHAVSAAMRIGGVHSVVLNVGGDIVARGAVSEPVDIADPKDDAENAEPIAHIILHGRAVATSGDYRRGVDIKGVHYSHIVDPRTGIPAGNIISSSVVSANPAEAGALATAFSILTPAESQKLAAAIPGVEYLLVEKSGHRLVSAGWSGLEASAQQPMSAALLAAPPLVQTPAPKRVAGLWDPTMELDITFEIPKLAGDAKRPFIAIWIEDTDKFPVRTLALWYHEDRFLTEVKAWFRADRLRSLSEPTSVVRSIGAATRPPGKYTIKWDGKDQAGNFVKPGKYIVSLESSREHGTYQINRREMTFGGSPQRVEFKPGSELGDAVFDYHKKVAK